MHRLLQGEKGRDKALEPTRRTWFGRLASLFQRSWDDALRQEAEELLLGADVGVQATALLLDRLEARWRGEKQKELLHLLRQEMVALLQKVSPRGQLWGREGPWPRPAVVLVVGVNGAGKTTSIGKLAHLYTSEGMKVVLAAADTFRAAAIEQLRRWGEMVGADVVAQREGADPAAVVYDAISAAVARHADLVLVDTAGRLHTKAHLMEELRKVQRVVARRLPGAPHEVLLVLDATIGQNSIQQARVFTEAVGVTGVFLAKLDGGAKGGVAFAIVHEMGLPILFLGTGEGPEDLAFFDPERFVDALLRP
jgi:fused signal recognition particle receptor